MIVRRLILIAGCGCALISANAAADHVTMRFQARIDLPFLDELNIFTFPDTQRWMWGRIVVDTDAPGRFIHATGTAYNLDSIEVFVGPQPFIADTLRELSIVNDNPDPGFEDVFRFDGFVGAGPDELHIESATLGRFDWFMSQAIPDLNTVRIDNPLVVGTFINIEKMDSRTRDYSSVTGHITEWRIVPAAGSFGTLAVGALAALRRRR